MFYILEEWRKKRRTEKWKNDGEDETYNWRSGWVLFESLFFHFHYVENGLLVRKLALYRWNFQEQFFFFTVYDPICIISLYNKLKRWWLLYPFLNLLSGGIITGLWGRWLMWCLNQINKHYTLNRICQSMYSIPNFQSPSQTCTLNTCSPHIYFSPNR